MMSKILFRKLLPQTRSCAPHRSLSVTVVNNEKISCKLLVVGGGTGGCTMAAKFARHIDVKSICILEPSNDHYYQPLFTLVGAGVTPIAKTRRSTVSVLPAGPRWLKDCAVTIDPDNKKVQTGKGDTIDYDYIIIACGLNNDYTQVPGLERSLQQPDSGVCSIFSPQHAEKTWSELQRFTGGHAVFTYPNTPIKCPGAPQKIAYLTDSYLNKKKIRSKAKITYNTCLPVIFGVKKYADALLKVVERKNIYVNYRTVLKEILPEKKEAVFIVSTDDGCSEMTMPYDLLHVTPPMATPEFLHSNKQITDATGYLDVDKYTLRHKKYDTMFGLGDCTNTPNSKTAAAISKQCYVLEMNMLAAMRGASGAGRYDGYGACPLVTSYSTCILAEFLYDGVVHETFPFNQAVERRISFHMKKSLFPFLYWNFMLKGRYHGPEFVRKIINPGGSKSKA